MKKAKETAVIKPTEFLLELLKAHSPSGYEFEAQKVLDKHVKPYCDKYETDNLGNRLATLNLKGNPTVMLAGHMDEIGFIISYVDDNGFIYFDTIGGHDKTLISGRRVIILTDKGYVRGVTGKRAIHLMTEEERKKAPELHKIWIDIGAKDKKEALKRVSIGDAVVYDHDFEVVHGNIVTARAFDDKIGCYVISEVLRRLSKHKEKLEAKVVSVATTQEEIGTRGAVTSCYAVDPQIGIAVDVGHATDAPDCDKTKYGEFKLGSGPIIARGPNINPMLFKELKKCAEKHEIPYQIEAEGRPTGTDARVLQMTRQGVATGLVSIPLRYMHTPCEVIHLEDVENAIKLITLFIQSLKKGTIFHW